MYYLSYLKPGVIITAIYTLLLFHFGASAQQPNPLINSGELLKQGNALHDKKQYKEAIELYKQINRSDTNYSTALYELSFSSEADSQFAAAHQYALEGLHLFPAQFPKFSMLAANALDDMNKPEDAIKIYDDALKKDPQSYILYFNKAVTQIRLEKFVEAKLNLQYCLLINPYYSSAHYFIGNIYQKQGNLIPAMLAYQTYLMLAPSGKYLKQTLANLNDISKVTDEIQELVKAKKDIGEDNFDMPQQILLSKIALDKQYELKVKLEDKIIRQIQVVDEKLEYKRNDQGFAMQFYVPLYIQLFKEGDFESLIYTIFSGLEIKDVNAWLKKNDKSTDVFVKKAIDYLNEIKFTRLLSWTDRKNATIKYYYENGEYIGKGAYSYNGTELLMTGGWEFYHTNGMIKAKGSFNSAGEKEGEWLYYYNTGEIKEKCSYKNGKINGQLDGWFDNGNKWYTDYYIDGKADGLSTGYFYNGFLRKTTVYKNDKKNGPEKAYNSTGHLLYTTYYKDDQEEGMQTNFYANGNIQDEVLYKNGKASGKYKSYYQDGKPMTEGEFIDDQKEGLWITRYNNGTIKEKTTYKENEITGEFTEYAESGQLTSKGNYTRKKIDGKLENYSDEGKLYSDAIYEKGKLKEINFYDTNNNIISSTSTRKGAADIVFYSSEGIKTAQGYFNREGNKDGEYIEYFSSGKINERTVYRDGILNGPHLEYYSNGQKKTESNFTNGEEDGNTKGYFYNGTLNYEGWVIKNQKQQNIIFYNHHGDITSKEYYLNDELKGYSEYYYPGNVRNYDYKYNNGWLENIVQYDSLGNVLASIIFDKGNGKLFLKHFNGKTLSESNYEHYMLNGPYKMFYFDGSPFSVSYYKNDELDSVYKSYYFGGQLYSQGKYVNGQKEGVWKYFYENGKLMEEEIYKDGKLNGIIKIYNEDGSLDKTVNYENNELEGEFTFFGENGQIALVLNYKKGIVKSYTYEDKTGNRVPAVILKGGSGKINSFYKNGSPSADINFLDNELNGSKKYFYSNGRPYIDATLEFGSEKGVKRVYYPNGGLMKEENYALGTLHGVSKMYYPNGKLEKVLNYYNGDLHRQCLYYDELGKIKQTRIYYFGNLLSLQ